MNAHRPYFAITRLVCLLILCEGCQSVVLSPKQAFFKKHPDLRSHYYWFYETSPEEMDSDIDADRRHTMILIHSIGQSYGGCSNLLERLNIVEGRVLADEKAEHAFVGTIKHVFNPHTDALYRFGYEEGEKYETGWLILRDSEIYKKFYEEGPFERAP
jgi:hypothetical protein